MNTHPILGVRRVWCCGCGAAGHRPCSAGCCPRHPPGLLPGRGGLGSTVCGKEGGDVTPLRRERHIGPVSTAGPHGPGQPGWGLHHWGSALAGGLPPPLRLGPGAHQRGHGSHQGPRSSSLSGRPQACSPGQLCPLLLLLL